MTRYPIYALIIVKSFLLVWGVLGLLEYGEPSLAFGLQNANFPRGVQFLHWLLILVTGMVFLGGFMLRWRYTVHTTIALYAMLATLCFVETVDFNAFGGGPERFWIMAAEYALYIALSAYLLRSMQVKERFAF